MRLLDVNGRPRFMNVSRKVISWDGESKSKFQLGVKKLLRPLWHHQFVYEEFPVYGTRYTIDFFNANRKIAIEVQGGQHTKFTKYFQADEFVFLKQLNIDEVKRKFCALNDIKLVEIFYEEKKELSTKFMQDLGL